VLDLENGITPYYYNIMVACAACGRVCPTAAYVSSGRVCATAACAAFGRVCPTAFCAAFGCLFVFDSLPIALVMDLHASKTIHTGPYKS
jgi:hypothetical protein